MEINILLFEGFEVLDAFGPVEIFSKLEGWELNFCSLGGGVIKSAQLVEVMTADISEIDTKKIFSTSLRQSPKGRGLQGETAGFPGD